MEVINAALTNWERLELEARRAIREFDFSELPMRLLGLLIDCTLMQGRVRCVFPALKFQMHFIKAGKAKRSDLMDLLVQARVVEELPENVFELRPPSQWCRDSLRFTDPMERAFLEGWLQRHFALNPDEPLELERGRRFRSAAKAFLMRHEKSLNEALAEVISMTATAPHSAGAQPAEGVSTRPQEPGFDGSGSVSRVLPTSHSSPAGEGVCAQGPGRPTGGVTSRDAGDVAEQCESSACAATGDSELVRPPGGKGQECLAHGIVGPGLKGPGPSISAAVEVIPAEVQEALEKLRQELCPSSFRTGTTSGPDRLKVLADCHRHQTPAPVGNQKGSEVWPEAGPKKVPGLSGTQKGSGTLKGSPASYARENVTLNELGTVRSTLNVTLKAWQADHREWPLNPERDRLLCELYSAIELAEIEVGGRKVDVISEWLDARGARVTGKRCYEGEIARSGKFWWGAASNAGQELEIALGEVRTRAQTGTVFENLPGFLNHVFKSEVRSSGRRWEEIFPRVKKIAREASKARS